MASAEHSLLFLLTAKVDSAFGEGFTLAQRQLAEMQKQVRDNQRTIGQIDAYEQATQALAKLTAEAQANGDTSAKTQNQIAGYEAKIRELEAALAAAGVDTKNLTAEQERLRAETERTKEEMTAWQNRVNRIRDIASIFSSLSMLAGELAKPIEALNEKMNDAVTVAKDFEYTMSAVKAVSGATAQEYRQLADEAKYLGATTVFTAQEVADAMEVQALAGWQTQEMIAGIPAVVHLAAAAGEDIAEVTGIVTDGLNAFHMEGTRAVNNFADVVVKGATSANTNVNLIGESLAKVETTAGNLGYSIEDVTIAIAAMADQAQKGTTAGTALNTVLTRMSGNENALKAMERLNLSIYDMEGNAEPLLTVLNDVRDVFAGMSQEEAQLAAYQLAGMRGMRGLLAITNTSQEAWDELTAAIYGSAGAAQQIADIRMDNYQGQLYLLESAQEALQTSYGESLLGIKTQWAEVKTEVVQDVNEIVKAHEWIGPATYGFTETLKTELNLIQGIAPVAMAVSMMVATIGQEVLVFAATLGTISAVVAATVAIVAARAAYIQRATEETEAIKESTDKLADSIAERRSAYQAEVAVYERQRTGGVMSRDEFNLRKSNLDTMQEEQERIQIALEDAQAAMAEFEAEHPNFVLGQGNDVATHENYANIYFALNKAQAEYDAHLEEMERERAAFLALVEESGGYDTGASPDDWLALYDAIGPVMEAYGAVYEEAYKSVSGQFTLWDEAGAYLNTLGEAYQTAFDKAKESYAGIFALWDSVEWRQTGDDNYTTFSGLSSNQSDQLTFWTNYRDRLTELQDSGVDLSDIWGQLTDGSMDSYYAVKAMTDELDSGGTGALEAYAEQWRTILGIQEEVAALSASSEAVTFETLMANLDSQLAAQEAYRANIEALRDAGLDLSGIDLTDMSLVAALAQELGTNGRDSTQGYIDKLAELQTSWAATSAVIAGLSPEVQAAVTELVNSEAWDGLQGNAQAIAAVAQELVADWAAETGNDALVEPVLQGVIAAVTAAQTEGESGMPGAADAAAGAFTAEMAAQASAFYGSGAGAIQQVINGMNSKSYLLSVTASNLGGIMRSNLNAGGLVPPGFAGGTDNAPPGWAWVGERGPELMWMHGGERVLDSETSLKLMDRVANAAPLRATPSYRESIGGGTSVQLTYAPVITAGSGTQAADIRRILSEDKDSLTDFLEEWADERESSRRRSVY